VHRDEGARRAQRSRDVEHRKPYCPWSEAASVAVERTPDQVFDPASIARFQGRPIVDDHPDDMVSPNNWQEHAIGHVMNIYAAIRPTTMWCSVISCSPPGVASSWCATASDAANQ
jgi:hypothetical protein